MFRSGETLGLFTGNKGGHKEHFLKFSALYYFFPFQNLKSWTKDGTSYFTGPIIVHGWKDESIIFMHTPPEIRKLLTSNGKIKQQNESSTGGVFEELSPDAMNIVSEETGDATMADHGAIMNDVINLEAGNGDAEGEDLPITNSQSE